MATRARKAYKGAGMEGWVARWYARTRQTDLADFKREAERVAERLPAHAALLEVAPGPGFFAVELARLGDFQITGLDISRTFVDIAREKARRAGVRVEYHVGNASAMPFPDATFDFVYCSAAFKNFSEPVVALDEMHRVLRPGGEALIVDLRKDVPMSEVDAYVRQSGRGRVDGWLTSWTFRTMLLKRAYTLQQLEAMAAQSRFGSCAVNVSGMGVEVRFRK